MTSFNVKPVLFFSLLAIICSLHYFADMCKHCIDSIIFHAMYETTLSFLLTKLEKADAHGNFTVILNEMSTPSVKMLANLGEEKVDENRRAFAILVKLEARQVLFKYHYSLKDIKNISDNAAEYCFPRNPPISMYLENSQYPGIYSDEFSPEPMSAQL